jgi:hypothetical protein
MNLVQDVQRLSRALPTAIRLVPTRGTPVLSNVKRAHDSEKSRDSVSRHAPAHDRRLCHAPDS